MRREMRYTILAIILLSAAIAGCTVEGDLTIKNETTARLALTLQKTEKIRLDPGETYSSTIYIGKSSLLIGPSEREIGFSGASWTKRYFTDYIDVKSDATTSYTVVSDCGAVLFINTYTKPISEMQLRECLETVYSDNILAEGQILNPADDIVLKLDPGCWWVKITYGNLDEIDSVQVDDIDIGDIQYINWNPED
jgi:hypothetical protein